MTSRTDFIETWLSEMPMGIGKVGDNFFQLIDNNIRDYIKHGKEPTDLPNGFKKIQGSQVAYYWHEVQDVITIAAEFTVKPQALVVNGVARNKVTGGNIDAVDLYQCVLHDNAKSIKLMSDDRLSDDGYRLWQRLLQSGHTISVYNNEQPGQPLRAIHTPQDMENFFKRDDASFKKWQYVLSEQGEKLAETRSYFNTRRMRELSGQGTED